MRLTSWNLQHGLITPPSTTANPPALIQAALAEAGCDLIGLQEMDMLLERSGMANQVKDFADALATNHWAFAPALMGSPDEDWRNPHDGDQLIVTSKTQSIAGAYGIGLVSKIPVISWHRLELKGSPVGIPMAFPVDGKMKRFYVRDHPRCALAAVLDNGWLIINTHLSFVPGFSLMQLIKIKKWANTLPIKDKKKIIIMGDLNIPMSIFARGFGWNSLASQKTFPSWAPRVQIDYFLSQKVASEDVLHFPSTFPGISDHMPLTIEID